MQMSNQWKAMMVHVFNSLRPHHHAMQQSARQDKKGSQKKIPSQSISFFLRTSLVWVGKKNNQRPRMLKPKTKTRHDMQGQVEKCR